MAAAIYEELRKAVGLKVDGKRLVWKLPLHRKLFSHVSYPLSCGAAGEMLVKVMDREVGPKES